MQSVRHIWLMVCKDALLEWRHRHTFFGVLLYIACTVFSLRMMMGEPEARLWNALFWVAQLFVVVNTVAKSFQQESKASNRYYYSILPAWQFVLAKLCYNFFVVSIVGLLTFFLFQLLLGPAASSTIAYLAIAIAGSGSLSLLFTFLSAIAAQASQGAALMAILGFPIAIPLIMILANVSIGAVSSVFQEGLMAMLLFIAAMDVLIVALAVVLFPYLWVE